MRVELKSMFIGVVLGGLGVFTIFFSQVVLNKNFLFLREIKIKTLK